MSEKISVIVPVYNAQKYLSHCMDSILGQTYTNLEVIAVNDGSQDDSLELLQEYAGRDERIKVISKKNEGVSAARNAAMKYAAGEFILFVDADDWISPITCEEAIAFALEQQADVVMWSYIREMKTESRKKKIFDGQVVFNQEDIRSKLYRRMIGLLGEELSHPENADALCTVWGKLYRKDVIIKNGITFYDIRKIGTYEDGLFNLDVFFHAKKAVFINRYFYHYRRNIEDSVTTKYNANLKEQWKHLFSVLQKHITENQLGEDSREALLNRIALSLIPLGINEIEKDGNIRDKIQGLKNIIHTNQYQEALEQLKMEYLPFHWKLFFYMARMNYIIGVYALLIVIQKIRGR